MFPAFLLFFFLFLPSFLWGEERYDDGRVEVYADYLTWESPDLLRATGKVSLRYREGWVEADTAVVDYRSRVVTAEGRIFWYTPEVSGYATYLTLNTENFTGEFREVVLWDATGGKVVGKRIVRVEKDRYKIYEGSFTPCRCLDQRVPSWEIHLYYGDLYWKEEIWFLLGTFYANGVPVLFLPGGYAPILKRRSTGFLLPLLSYTSRYGFSIEPGFFLPLGDSHDLTFRYRYTTLAGSGGYGKGNFLTYTGGVTVEGEYFQERRSAPYLRLENRGPSRRYRFSLVGKEFPFHLFRMGGSLLILSDERQPRDFATNLASITLEQTLSRVEISKEVPYLFSSGIRFLLNQSLVSTQSSGSRFPSFYFRTDPFRVSFLPMALSGEWRYDRVLSYQKRPSSSPWQLKDYRFEGGRFFSHLRWEGFWDFLPGLHFEPRAGTFLVQRFVRPDFSSSLLHVLYSEPSLFLRGGGWVGPLSFRGGVGFRGVFSRVITSDPIPPWEDIDSVGNQRYLVPEGRLGATLFGGGLFFRVFRPFPSSSPSFGQPLTYRIEEYLLSYGKTSFLFRGFVLGAYRRVPRIDFLFSTPLPIPWITKVEGGYARWVTSPFPYSYWEVGYPTPFGDDPKKIPLLHEGNLSFQFSFRRFSGEVSLRRRFSLEERKEPPQWVERKVTVRYTSPCQCWYIQGDFVDLPGESGDRIEISVELLRLGKVGVQQ